MRQDYINIIIPHMTKTNEQFQLIDLSKYGFLKLIGADAHQLLQGQITIDVRALSSNQAQLAALCNPQGRVISLFYIFLDQSDFYLLMPKNLLPITSKALKKYAIFYKAKIIDESNLVCFGILSGQNCSKHLPKQIRLSPALSIVFGKKNDFESSSNFASDKIWKNYHFNQGTPELSSKTSGMFLPHELNLIQLGAVDFNKGCYTGQEIIARMHYKGKIKKGLYLAEIKTFNTIAPADQVYSVKQKSKDGMAEVVDAYRETHDTYRALLLLNHQAVYDDDLYLKNEAQSYFKILKNIN